MNMKMIYTSLSAICIYELYVYMYDMSMMCMIWMLIHVYLMFCSDSTTVVDLSLVLSVVGSVLIKVRGNMSVAC